MLLSLLYSFPQWSFILGLWLYIQDKKLTRWNCAAVAKAIPLLFVIRSYYSYDFQCDNLLGIHFICKKYKKNYSNKPTPFCPIE